MKTSFAFVIATVTGCAFCCASAVAEEKNPAPDALQTQAQPSAPAKPKGPMTGFAKYAAAAGDTYAARAALSVLKAGGSAADGAAAAILALGVTSPASSGLGGGGLGLYYNAKDQTLTFLDFREMAPKAATATMFEGKDKASEVGGLAVGVPGEPAGIEELLKRFGKIKRARVVQPAIRLAEDGFIATPYLSQLAKMFGEGLEKDAVTQAWFKDGQPFGPGATLRNPALAKTLREFARSGSKPFYTGKMAKAIVEAVKKSGGIMTAEDLASYKVVQREPVAGNFFGYTWVSAPPPSAGGYTLVASLGLLARWMPHPGSERASELLHALAESWKGPFMDRASYFGDPEAMRFPLAVLTDPSRMAKRAAMFKPQEAQDPFTYMIPIPGVAPAKITPPDDHGTSHVCVIDEEGNVASMTTSINLPFGARFTVNGMLMNDQMDDFAKGPGEANAFGLPGSTANLPGPGKRPVSTMTPTIVFDGAGPKLCAGGSGGSRIVTAVEQASLYALLYGNSVLDAVSRPRVHHQALPDALQYEKSLKSWEPIVVEKLKARKHHLEESPSVYGRVQMIRINHCRPEDPNCTRLEAASDPRNNATAAGE